MTDRDLPVSADSERPSARPLIEPLTADTTTERDRPLQAVDQGDPPPMSVTTICRPLLRVVSSGPPPGETVQAFLDRLMAAASDFPAFSPVALKPCPSGQRLPAEAHAAARAAACPDLFLIHAADPLAGERVIADIAQASLDTTADGRILILSPNPAAADRITERLVRVLEVAAVRALAEDENPTRPSPVVARHTSTAVGLRRLEQAQQDLAATIARAEARLAQLDQVAALRLQLVEVDSQLAAMDCRLTQLETEVRTDPTVTARINQLTADAEAIVSRLTASWQTACDEQRKLEAEATACRKQPPPATRRPGFFARLFGSSKSEAHSQSLATLTHDYQQQASEAAARAAALEQELETAVAELTALREQAFRDAIAERQRTLEAERATLAATRQQLRSRLDSLEANSFSQGDPAAIRHAIVSELAEANHRVNWLASNRQDAIRQFLAESRVVVATPGSLGVDPVLELATCDACAAATPPRFTLLILDRAEELTQAEFLRLSQLASRWVLVGDTSYPLAPRLPATGMVPPQTRNSTTTDVPFVTQLAQALDRERWVCEGDRLVCRLVHLSPTERRGLDCEPVLDRPEIELRIGTNNAGEPVLAEVAFPLGTPIADAKAFVFHQLGEVLLDPCGELCWDHTPPLHTARWPAADGSATPSSIAWVELEPGVRECVVGGEPPAFTAAVTFDPAAGWDAAQAEAWLALHLGISSPARFAVLPRTNALPRAALSR